MGTMHVMGPEGDVEIVWDPADEESTAKAAAEFDALQAAGMEFFSPGSGKGNRRRKKFDPKLGKIIAAPGVAKPSERKASTPGKAPPREKAMRGGPVAARSPR